MSKKRQSSLAVLTLLLSSCSGTVAVPGGGGGPGTSPKQNTPVVKAPTVLPKSLKTLNLDPKLLEPEFARVAWIYDFAENSWRGQTATADFIDQAAAELFGSDAAGLTRYLGTRVHTIFSSQTELTDFGTPSRNTVARNVGSALFLDLYMEHFQNGGDPLTTPSLRLNSPNLSMSLPRVIGGTRVGLIQTADAFSRSSDIDALDTLVHEARHSDCPGGLRYSNIKKVLSGKITPMKAVERCGFIHMKCPTGHDLAGSYACEMGSGWGPYATTLLLARRMFQTCQNCTREQIETLKMTTYDSATRIPDIGDLVDGKLGVPNLDHQGFVLD